MFCSMTRCRSHYFAIFLYDFVFIGNCSWIKLAGPDIASPAQPPTATLEKRNHYPESSSLAPNLNDWNNIRSWQGQNRSYANNTTSSTPSLTPSSTIVSVPATIASYGISKVTIASELAATTDAKVTNVSNEIDEIISKISLAEECQNDRTLLTDLDELADNVKSNFRKNSTTFEINSWVTTINANESSIIERENSGTRITLLAAGIGDLKADSIVKIVHYKTYNDGGVNNNLIVVKAILINESSSSFSERPMLRIEFEVVGFGWTCVYWDYREHVWKNDGISTIQKNHVVTCVSNHLSTFSIVADPYLIMYPEMPLYNEHESILTFISVVGSTISIPCLLIVLVVYYRRRTINETNKILFNSCVAFLLVHVSYQLYVWLPGTINCAVINIIVHYSVLSFLLWTASDGVNMLRILFTDIFNTNGYVFYRWYKIVSWGFPGVASAVGIVFFDNRDRIECRLYFDRYVDLFLYLMPCTLILACNSTLFCWMLIKITCRNSLGRLKEKKLDYVLAMSQVFGIAWCVTFPLLWFAVTRVIGQYLFAVLVSTEDILVFVVRCAKDRNWRRQFMSNVYSLNVPLSTSSRSRTGDSGSGGTAARTSNPTLSGLSDKF